MAILTEDIVLKRADRETRALQKSVKGALQEAAGPDDIFDVFLSHSSAESEKILLGVKGLLEDEELSVYVDRYDDPQLSLAEVTVKTAALLRKRLRASRTLLYVYSGHSKASRWMPWELGFFDGMKRPLGVLPVVKSAKATFKGEEYLGLYPYIDRAKVEDTSGFRLWTNHAQKNNTYAELRNWVKGADLKTHS